MLSKHKIIVIIGGPTAVGKTAISIDVAKAFSTQIISADSRQCYKEMSVGVARPSEEELNEVPHYFIASHSIHEPVNAALFMNYALKKSEEIFREKDVAVMVGGTGLYIKAFTEGIDEMPSVPQEVRQEIIDLYNANGLPWLQQTVKEKDPAYFATGEILNPRRLMRVLEIAIVTGKSILDFKKGEKAKRNFSVIKAGLQLPKEALHYNISMRVDKMIRNGLMAEAESLQPFQHLPPLNTVGYKELFPFLNGNVTKDKAIEAIKHNTRQYAKRQLTWFKKDPEFHWLHPDADRMIAWIKEQLYCKKR